MRNHRRFVASSLAACLAAAVLAGALTLVPGALVRVAYAAQGAPSRGAVAAAADTPKPGSRARKAIMDALRGPVQKRVGRRVIFVVGHLKIQNGYAFLHANARRPDGKELSKDYLWGELAALLRRKSNGTWVVLHWGFGTDTGPMETAKRRYPNAPRAIFPDFGG